METNVIIIKNISKKFFVKNYNSSENSNVLVALNNVSFSIPKGKTIGIIGSNGSGKTTLLRVISGIYPPDHGTIEITGKIAPLLQIGTGFNGELDARENITIYGLLLGFTKTEISEKIKPIIEFAELEKFTAMKLKYYSTGMRVRLAFSTALQVNPDILLVDEVLSVGDMSFQKKSLEAFLSFKNENKTILFTSHNMQMISKICDHVLLLNNGELLMEGKPDEVIRQFKELSNKD